MKIRFANETTVDGQVHKAGSTAEIKPNGLARSLILRGKAVEAPKKSSAAAETTQTPAGETGKE